MIYFITVILLIGVYNLYFGKNEYFAETASVKFKKPLKIIDNKVMLDDIIKIELKGK